MQDTRFFSVVSVDNTRYEISRSSVETIHFAKDRVVRHTKITTILGYGKQIGSFVVDRNHPNGNEIHTIYSSGVIVVRNVHTKMIVTEMVARAPQIARYWRGFGLVLTNEVFAVMAKARENEQMGYNNW